MLLRHSISSAAFAALSQSLLIAAPSVAKETSKYSTQLIFSAEYANIGEECDDFTSKAPRDAVTYHEVSTSADVGILKCDMSSVCLPDTTSSRGGRCTQSSSTTRARVLRPESKTILESPTNNTCSKCVGTEACAGLSAEFIDNNIGCGSCIEAFSCRNLNETGSKIGVGSCVGYKSCEGISGAFSDVLSSSGMLFKCISQLACTFDGSHCGRLQLYQRGRNAALDIQVVISIKFQRVLGSSPLATRVVDPMNLASTCTLAPNLLEVTAVIPSLHVIPLMQMLEAIVATQNGHVFTFTSSRILRMKAALPSSCDKVFDPGFGAWDNEPMSMSITTDSVHDELLEIEDTFEWASESLSMSIPQTRNLRASHD
eukprot:scaffold323_cov91-Cyclotella_meneghiniana.AAC.4